MTNNTTYYGKDLQEFYTDALLTGDSLKYFRQILDAKYKVKIPYLNIGNLFQEGGNCGSTATTNSELDQKSITVCPIDINHKECTNEWEATFKSEMLKAGSNYAQLPDGLQQYILDIMKSKISAQSERMTWQGSTTASPPDACDGLIKKLLADSDVIDVASWNVLTKNNIVAEIETAYNLIPTAVLNQMANGSTKVKGFISPSAARFYMQAMYGTFPAINAANNGEFRLNYLNTELIVAPGLPNNTMVFADPDNLIFATDLTDDMSNIEIVVDPTPGSKAIHFVTSFKWAVDFAKGAEIVLYGVGS